ncbi:MAG: FtsK/SpoIIIE domain-containing protein, partial [Phycisphaerales bacterium]|nr:FtsK/SpoIIIE domain-containing protein [Phycisphaerales bacterium]
MPESILTQQRAEIAAIRTLIGQTTEEERALMERLAEDRRGASQRQQREHEELDSELTQARAEADRTLAAQKTALDKRRDLEPKLLKDKHTDRIEEIRDHAEELAETTKNKLNEAIWLAESVYEAAVPAIAKRVEELHEKLDDASKQLDELCEEAPRTLTRLRQQTEESFDDAGQDGDAVDPRSMIELVKSAENALQAIRLDPKARWFIGIKPVFIVTIAVLIAGGIGGAVGGWSINTTSLALPIAAAALSIATLIVLYGAGQDSIRSKLRAFREAVAAARTVRDATIRGADLERRRRESEIRSARDEDVKAAEDSYGPRLARVEELMEKDLGKERKRFTAVEQRLQEKLEEDAAEVDGAFEATRKEIDAKRTQQSIAIDAVCKATLDGLDADEQDTMDRLHERWHTTLTHFRSNAAAQRNACEEHAAWTDGTWDDWSPPESPSSRVPIGTVDVDLSALGGQVPQNERLALGEPIVESLPLCMTLPRGASMLVSTSGGMRGVGIAAIQNAVLRTLTSLPAGKAELTLIDPVALGQSFAGILHLADFDEAPLVDRAWTEPRHIESQLADLTEHMETVIQKYLRNEFESIDDYNKQAGEIAEPYRFLVIADFPVNISEQAGKRLASILTSGARCGVHVLMHRDIAQELPPGIDQDTLEQIELRLIEHEGSLIVDDPELRSLPLVVEEPPSDQVTTAIIKAIGEVAQDTHRVEVPFRVIAPSDEDLWSRSTTGRIAVPLGRAGATQLQSLTLGRGTAQHALIAGKTGSGKSTLLHVLITNLALWYSPDEVEFYLVDFKKGVEFKTYATHNLPHARVVAVESDREFGISVLQRLDQELKARGERFRDLGAQDVAAFREKEPGTPMPRILLVVDEFQEFFIDDDSVAQEANLLLDRLVRQGRAFGI